MVTKKHNFTRNKKVLFQHIKHIGNKSGIVREKKDEILRFESKSNAPAPQLPNNHQNITERKLDLFFISKFIAFGILLLVGLAGFLAITFLGIQAGNVIEQRMKLEKQMKLWQSVAKDYPNYRDANFQVALIAYRLGNREVESEYLAKVLEIDPNYRQALLLQNKY